MNWFNSNLTSETIKARYRELAKQHHPDLGGDTETMQDINASYLQALKRCDGQESHGSDGRPHTYHYNEERESAIMDKIRELLSLKMDGVDVYLIGLWIWVMGETRPHKEALKALGMKWSPRRSAWSWKPYKGRTRRSNASLGAIAATYGCRRFDKYEENAVVAA